MKETHHVNEVKSVMINAESKDVYVGFFLHADFNFFYGFTHQHTCISYGWTEDLNAKAGLVTKR